ncbi:amino acid ABC transporter permease, partial [Halorubrum sp. SD626R]
MSALGTLAPAAVDSLGALASGGAPSVAASDVAAVASGLVVGTADWWFIGEPADWWFVLDNADYLGVGVLLTIGLTVASILFGFALGFPAGAVEVYGDGLLKRAVGTVGVVLRGTPIVVILIVMY